MKKNIYLPLRMLIATAFTAAHSFNAGAQDRLISTFNADRPILPSS